MFCPVDLHARNLIGIFDWQFASLKTSKRCSSTEARKWLISVASAARVLRDDCRHGMSKPISLVQYTEPQLSPQHIMVKKLNANTVAINWEPPFMRTNDVKVRARCRTTCKQHSFSFTWSIGPTIQLIASVTGKKCPFLAVVSRFPS